jgi:hypothetical protein
MHGAFAGAPRGERHGNYRHGRRSIAAKELGQALRALARDIDVKTASVMHAHGFKPPKPLRRKVHVRKALAEARKAKAAAKAKEGEKVK